MPEPPLDVERRKAWYHSSLIPYILAGKVHAFMGHLPEYIKKPQLFEYFLPIYHGYEPLVFVDKPFKFYFCKNRVIRSTPPTEDV